MNRDDRRHLFNASYRYCSTSMHSLKEFAEAVERMKSCEEEKIGNLPDNLQNTEQAESINEAVEHLSEILDNLESVEELLDEIAGDTGIDYTYIQTLVEKSTFIHDGPRTKRFQILLSDQMMHRLRLQAKQRGISCNELICTALQNELSDSSDS